MMKEIHVITLADALTAQEIMEEFYGDNDFERRSNGDCYIVAPDETEKYENARGVAI